ncbi:hypothetical protein [Burkholderia sp. 22PA0106]|uniref:hypothetical protein n=1 Tax=Burkholderia sp. 22PA0106 TaxID=3237371 RepID=UPI0039C0744C
MIPIRPRSMPASTSHGAARLLALGLALTPSLCHADSGSPGGTRLFTVLALAAGWLLLTVFLFTKLRRARPLTRYLATALFLCAPLPWLAVTYRSAMQTGPQGAMREADAPVQMGGATFPAGSRVQTRVANGQPAAITSERAVALGTLSIRGIEHRNGDAGTVYRVTLAFDQSLDGWPCAAIGETGTRVDVSDPHAPTPRLLQCQLAKTVNLGDIAWPPATVVERAPDGAGWTLRWSLETYSQVGYAKGFSFNVNTMSGNYDAARKLTAWQGRLAVDDDVGVGSVTFAANPQPALRWQRDDNSVQVTGQRAGAPAQATEACVKVAARPLRYLPCSGSAPAKAP